MSKTSELKVIDIFMDNHLVGKFKNPPDEFRPVPWLCYTGECSETEVYRSIDEMYKQGISSFFIFPIYGIEIEYLSDAWFDIVEKTLAYCKKKGMTVWIYDDYNWPNGSCAGKLTDAKPEYAIRKAVVKISNPIMPGDTAEIKFHGEILKSYRVDIKNNMIEVEASIECNKESQRVKWTNNTKEKNNFGVLSCHYNHTKWVANRGSLWNKSQKGYGFTDLLQKNASELFIKMTYDKYFERFKNYFGTTISGFFNDESSVFGFHYNQDLADTFKKRNGYHLKDKFIHLFISNSPERFKIRYDYWSLVGEGLAAHLERINEWCAERDVDFTGHFLGEESPEQEISAQGSIWPVRKHMSIPGSDLLGCQSNYGITPARKSCSRQKSYSPSGLILTIKVAAATARFNGAQRVMCEAFGVMPYNMAPVDQMIHTHWLTALGINLINDNLLALSFESFRKRALGGKHFTTPWWKYYRDFTEFAGRCSMMTSIGRIPAKIGLLYPAFTAQVLKCERGINIGNNPSDNKMLTQTNRLCQNTAEALTRGQWDWEIVFEECWQDAQIAQSDAQIADLHLTTLIIPAAHGLNIKVLEKLESFAKSEGRIIFIGAIPSIMLDKGVDIKKRILTMLELPNVSFVEADDDSWMFIMEKLKDAISEPPAAHLTGIGVENVLVVRRSFENKDIFHIVNMGDCQAKFMAKFDTGKPLTLWNPDDGELYSIEQKIVAPSTYQLTLSSGEGFFLTTSDEDIPAGREYNSDFKIDISPHNSLFTRPNEKLWTHRSLGIVEWELMKEQPNIARLSPFVKFDPDEIGIKMEWQNGEPDNSWIKTENARLPSSLNPLKSRFIWYKAVFKAEHIPTDLALVVDNMDFSEVFLNGEKLESPELYTLWDYANIKFNIANKVKPGNNILAIKAKVCDYYHPDVCLSNIFAPDRTEPVTLIGDFYHDNYQEDIACLRLPRAKIKQGDWSIYGMKNYMGSLVYKRNIEFELPDDEIWLDLGEVHCIAELKINGREAGRRSWSPYRFQINDYLKKGNNLFEITVTNTLASLLKSPGWNYVGEEELEPKSGLYGPVRFYSR